MNSHRKRSQQIYWREPKIKRYCQFKAEQSHKELIALHHQGVAALKTSIVVLVPCFVVGVIYTMLLQSGVKSMLEALFIVIAAACVLGASWVALWMPAEYFL